MLKMSYQGISHLALELEDSDPIPQYFPYGSYTANVKYTGSIQDPEIGEVEIRVSGKIEYMDLSDDKRFQDWHTVGIDLHILDAYCYDINGKKIPVSVDVRQLELMF